MIKREKAFLDSNIIVYAYDLHEPKKNELARQILKDGISDGNVVLSAQVLGEFFVVATKKIKEKMTAEQALDIIKTLDVINVVDIDYYLVISAINIQRKYKLSYWDSLILAAAERAECDILLTEDLNNSQTYNGVAVRNPFL